MKLIIFMELSIADKIIVKYALVSELYFSPILWPS